MSAVSDWQLYQLHVYIGLGNGLVTSSNKTLPEPIFIALWHHKTNELSPIIFMTRGAVDNNSTYASRREWRQVSIVHVIIYCQGKHLNYGNVFLIMKPRSTEHPPNYYMAYV